MKPEQKNVILRPVKVSIIEPVYDSKNCLTDWGLTVTFNGRDITPPHARGARVKVENADRNTLAKYFFPESVMGQGLERAYLFRDAMLRQIARQGEER